MPNLNAKLVSAVFAGVLTGATFIPGLNNSAHAEETCLTAPNGQTPQGSHWYYRLERGTKRHCWHLGAGDKAHSQSAAATSSPPPAPAKPAPAKADASMQGPVTDAHAELPWPQPGTASQAPAAIASAPAPVATVPAPTEQVPAATAAAAPDSDGTQPSMPTAAAGDPDVSQATIASRWPDPANASAPDDSGPEPDNSATAPQPDTASAPPPPAAAAVPLATADASPSAASGKQPGSMQTLLTIMIAALALAGLVAGAILRFGGRKGDEGETDVGIDRHPVWDREHSDRALRYPTAAAHRPNIGRPRELRSVEGDDPIKEMLARLARSAQT